MRRFNLFALFVLIEALLLYIFVEWFLRASQSILGWMLCAFGVVQFVLFTAAMRVAELERNRGKSRKLIARESSRRDYALALWSGGLIYLIRLGLGVWHVEKSGWSRDLLVELAIWTIGAGALFYYVHLQPHIKRSRE